MSPSSRQITLNKYKSSILKVITSQNRSSFHSMKPPVKLGAFSVSCKSGSDVYEEGTKCLQVLKLPDRLHGHCLCLKDGYRPIMYGGARIRSFDQESGMSGILNWLTQNRDKKLMPSKFEQSAGKLLAADFVSSSQDLIVKIMTTPYKKQDEWCIGATRFKGTIYLQQFLTDKERQREEKIDDFSNMLMYCGRRFERSITAAGKGTRSDNFCVLKSEIGGHRIVCYDARYLISSHDSCRHPEPAYSCQVSCVLPQG